MPRLPGRESTRKTVPKDHALVASFVVVDMDRNVKGPCHIDGCDHRIENCNVAGTGWLPAWVVHKRDINTVIGLGCTCCVQDIVA